MRKNRFQRTMALLLALVLLLGFSPAAFAAGGGPGSADVTGITLNKADLSLTVGGEETLIATLAPADAAAVVSWTCDNEAAAIVDSTGKVTAVAPGAATVTAYVGDFATGPKASCLVTVNAASTTIPVESITLNKTELTLAVAGEETLTATVLPDDATDKTVTWTSSDESVATVDQSGNVTGVKTGTAAITAEAGGLKTDCAVTVAEGAAVPVSSVTLDITRITDLVIGGQRTLTATVLPENASDKLVTWTSSNENVVTVAGGVLTGVSMGTATITATAGDYSAECQVTVAYAPATGITIPETATVKVGEQTTIAAILSSAPGTTTDPTNVQWNITARSDVISINTDHGASVLVTGAKPGRATLSAKAVSFDGSPVTCTVTVPGIQITHRGSEVLDKVIEIPLNGQYTFGVQPYGADVPNGTPTWVSSSVGVAYFTNAASGTLVGQSLGSTQITATIGSYSCTATVRVVENTANSISTSVKSDATLSLGSLISSLRSVYVDAMDGIVKNPSSSNLSYLTNLSVSTAQGVLYYKYVSANDHGYGVGSTERYYLSPYTGQRGLSDVTFVPDPNFTGTAVIYYTGFDKNANSFSGTIRVSVNAGEDVVYSTALDTPLTFRATDFNDVHREVVGRDLRYVTFDPPESSKGTLYYNYVAEGQYSGLTSSTDRYYRSTTPSIDRVTFVPAKGFSGSVRITYHVVDSSNTTTTGRVTITVSGQAASASQITYTAPRSEEVSFKNTDLSSACLAILNETLDYVYFTPPDNSLGTLWYRYTSTSTRTRVTASTRYYQTNSSTRPGISGVYFDPASTTVGTVTVPFTAYSTGGHRFNGTIDIIYTDIGEAEIHYTTQAGVALLFDTADFNEACLAATGESFTYLTFDSLPLSTQGRMRYNYTSATSTGSELKTTTRCYRTSSTPQLSRVAFIPSTSYDGVVEIPFTAYNGSVKVFSGAVYIRVESSTDQIVRYSTYSGKPLAFSGSDFNAACQATTGKTLNYVRFTLPDAAHGVLYYNYAANKTNNTKVTNSTNYYYTGTSTTNRRIDTITFLPPANFTGTVELAYTGFATGGTQYSGTAVITVNAPVATAINYSTGSLPIRFAAASFYQACSGLLDGGLSYIQFSNLPTSGQGKLCLDYVSDDPNSGSAAVQGTRYYYNATPGINQLTFVPKAGYSGRVSLQYTGYDTKGNSVAGTVTIAVTEPTTTARFTDMGTVSWAVPAVDFLNNAGIVTGTTATTYSPRSSIKRCDFVVMLCRAYGLNTGSSYSFSDVPPDSYYAWAVATARDLDIVQGTGNGLFRPNASLTRQDAMVMLQRTMRAVGWTTSGSSADLVPFTDSSRISSYARDAVAAMVHMGIVQGNTNQQLKPTEAITRAEMAVILHRVMTL